MRSHAAEMLAPLRTGPGLIGAGIAVAVFSLGGVAMGSYEPVANAVPVVDVVAAPVVKDQSRIAPTADRIADLGWVRMASIDPNALAIRFTDEGAGLGVKPPLIERDAPTIPTPFGVAMPLRGVASACLPPRLKAALSKVQQQCTGFRIVSAFRKNARVAGSGRASLHASCKAADFQVADYSCAYRVLKNFPGGVSTDARNPRINHIHASDACPGRECGARFAHYSGGKNRTRHGKRRAA